MGFFDSFFAISVPVINVKELHEKLADKKKPFLLDVRQPEEYRLGHIPGTKLIPLGELERRLKEVPPDREIVCICASGHRSVEAAQILKAAGYTSVSLQNGMFAWQMAKLPISKGV
ncbi:MAG TPA: rhodanese-like domain-containing protein [Anaerolineales bacterium]|nr:rhodanese-like domain-containing protein [Anaerolineales bacterium]